MDGAMGSVRRIRPGVWDIGPVRDPAFMAGRLVIGHGTPTVVREPNPVVAIKTESGVVIWREEDDPERWTFAKHVADAFEVPMHLVRPASSL